jgi:AraC family transcriptional regulator of arabinose operon
MEPILKNLHDLMPPKPRARATTPAPQPTSDRSPTRPLTRTGIPEGFRGQHLVVLPASVRRSAEKHPLLRGLLVTDAGLFPRAADHLIRRPKGSATSLVILCTAGHGWVELAGKTHALSPGSLAWLPARRPHAYGSSDDSAWTIEWAHFSGDETDAWRDLLQLPPDGGVLSLELATASTLGLPQLSETLGLGYSLANLVTASTALRTTLTLLTKRTPSGSSSHNRSAEERVAASADWMRTHLAQPIRLEELAQLAAVSIPHYCTLFKRHTGFAPIDWLIRLRIQRACQLLDTTTDPIAAIGARAGFLDPYYFTRCFRRIMGHPPRAYRQIAKG